MIQQKQQLKDMKMLKEKNIKALQESKNDMYAYKRKAKEYTETIKQLNNSIREYNRRLKSM
jgi:hypothetical protein